MDSLSATLDEDPNTTPAHNELLRRTPAQIAAEAALASLLEWYRPSEIAQFEGLPCERLLSETRVDDCTELAAVRQAQMAEVMSWPGAAVDFVGHPRPALKRALLAALRNACEANDALGRAHHALLAEAGMPTAAETKRMAQAIAKYGWD